MEGIKHKGKTSRGTKTIKVKRKVVLSEAGVVCYVILPALTHLSDTLNISHQKIKSPDSFVCTSVKEIESNIFTHSTTKISCHQTLYSGLLV